MIDNLQALGQSLGELRNRFVELGKEAIMRDEGIQAAKKKYTEAVYYCRMYYSEACITDPNVLTLTLKNLKSDKGRRDLLKEQINIRIKGFGGKWREDFTITWSHQRKLRPIEDLETRLREILKAENDPDSGYNIPETEQIR